MLTFVVLIGLLKQVKHLRLPRVLEVTHLAAGDAAMEVKANDVWLMLISIFAYAAICGLAMMG